QSSPSDQIPLQVIVVPSAQEAQQVLERLKNGGDFSALAREKSIDPTASAWGYMGKFALKELRAELRDVLHGVAPGQVSKVVHIPSGYAVLKVLTSIPVDTRTPDLSATLGLTARGSVRPMLRVFGLAEADEALRHYPKAKGWELDPHKTCELRKKSLSAVLEYFEKLLAPEKQAAL